MTEQVPLSVLFDNYHKRMTSERLVVLSSKLALQLRQTLSELEIPQVWSVSDAIKIEAQKASLRSDLRYSFTGIKLAAEVARLIARTYFDEFENTYHTLLYPMIHVAGDKAEEGVFHTDQVTNLKLRTGWTAITDYNYTALSFIPFGLLLDSLSRRILRFPLQPSWGFPINARLGDTLTWGGGYYHRGNHNSSHQLSCAVVVRVTDKPLFLERTRQTDTAATSLDAQTSELTDNGSFGVNERVQSIHALIERVNHIDYSHTNEYSCSELAKYLADYGNLPDPRLSFSLSILAQRIRTVSHVFYDDQRKAEFVSYILDLMSLLCGAENLSSLQNAKASIFGRDLPIVEQLEESLSGSLVTQTEAWAMVTGKKVSTGKLAWWF